MIKRLLTLMMLWVTVCVAAEANSIDLNFARKVGAKFINGSTEMRAMPNELTLATTYNAADGTTVFYVFNVENGFVIVAADDCSTPILGYSEEGVFNPDNVPVQMEQYLQGFVEQIQYGIENKIEQDETVKEQWETVLSVGRISNQRSFSIVEPLLTTKWNQNCYYNNLCPTDVAGPCGHVYAGCVATSMAQILKYWQWPVTGTGTHSYTPDGYPTQTVDFGSTSYDWVNMSDTLTENSSTEEINAVATLMWHCGVAVDMMYGYDGSGAYSSYIPDALVNYFNYSNEISRISRWDYTAQYWLNLIKTNLDNGCPVQYSAQDENGNGGHAFVCDGYDSADQLHFNWGWGGNGDGYFALDALNIYGYQWNNSVYAILNIRPTNTCVVNAVPNRQDGGSVTGGGTYFINDTCNLTAIPADRFAFNNWTSGGIVVSTNPTYSFTVTENTNIVANFNRVNVNEVTIGTTSSTSGSLPLSLGSYYSISQQIYTASEIGINGDIDEIAFYYYGNNSSTVSASIDVYLKHTTKSAFESNYDWENMTSDDLYFTGTFTIDGSSGWKPISLDRPFEYNGDDNLLICVNNHTRLHYYDCYWYTYSGNYYRSIQAYNSDDGGYYDPSDITASGSRYSYNNMIKLGFRVSQPTTLVANSDPIDIGYRPNGAWTQPAQVNIVNQGMGTNITNISINNSYFQIDTNNLEIPFYLGYNDGFNLDVNTATGDGEINATLTVDYGSPNQQAQFDLDAIAYTPVSGDVWETAQEISSFPYYNTWASAAVPIYNNYHLPPAYIADGPDAVYKLTFTEDTYLNAHITDGENGKVALYPEGFDNVGGPDLYNNYTKPIVTVHEWLSYDNGTYRTNVRHNSGTTIWGVRYTTNDLAQYAGTKMTKVELYSNQYTGGHTKLGIYTGGTDAPDNLVLSQEFDMVTGLNDYYTINLDSPIRIFGNENIWVVFTTVNQDYYPAVACNNYYDSQYNGCRWYDGDNWMTLTDYGNWKIRSYITTGDGRAITIGYDEEDTEEKGGTRDIITIGDGGTYTNECLPSHSYYNYSLTQQIYTAEEIGGAGGISSVAFYNSGSEKTRLYTIYMVNTDKMSFNNNYDWITVSSDDQVFSGSVTMSAGGWTTIDFDNPFAYDGSSNLAIIVDDNTGSYSSGMSCRVFTPTNNNCSLRIYNDGTNYDPCNPSSYNGTILSVKNQIQLNIASSGNGITDMTVTPGTYYLAASSTSNEWTIGIETASVPCPAAAYNPTPANNATNVTPTFVRLRWKLGKRTTEYMLKFGTTPECEDTLVEWTRDLSQSYTLGGIQNSTQYYWKVVERNGDCDEGVEGPTWNFKTILSGPSNLQSNNGTNFFVGDSVQLSWTAMTDTCIRSYNIYQNNVLVGNSTTNNYIVRDLAYNITDGYFFKVTGVYAGGESAFSNTVKVYFSGESLIGGHVYEQDSITAIPNANVVFNGRDEFNSIKTYTFTTDSVGYFNGSVRVGSYSAMATISGYQNKSYPENIDVVYGENNLDVDFIMDEMFGTVGDVYVQHYPDSINPDSPYAKVCWESTPIYHNIEDFESGDFSLFDWEQDQVYPWQITSNNTYEGNFCMMCGNKNVHNSNSSIQVTVDIPCNSQISFYSKISSESCCDHGIFYIDGNQKDSWGGTYDWAEHSYAVTAGTHTFTWTYSKDGSANDGDDCFYIDYIRFYDEDDNRGEPQNRSFQHYRVYRTDFYNNGPYTEDNSVLIANVVTDTLYVDESWSETETGVYKYGVSKVYEGNRGDEISMNSGDIIFMDDFEDGIDGWTRIDADGDGYNWQYNNSTGGHDGSAGLATSASYSNSSALTPDNYLVTPLVNLGGSITFWACAQDAGWAAEHFGIAVSTTSNTDPSAFTTVQEWTMSAKSRGDMSEHTRGGSRDQGTWYQYVVDLSAFANQTGYIAIRHFNCSDYFRLNVDDVIIMGSGSPLIQSGRESKISWSNALDQNMYLTDGAVNVTVSLNSGDSPEGVSVTFRNTNTGEQQFHPTENNVVLDTSGYYAWNNFRKGDYQITIAKEGYDTITEQVSVWEATSLNYLLNEIVYSANNLYVSRTGWAMWQDHNNSPIPELTNDCFEYDFDNGNTNGITFINADSYSSNWMLASQKFGTGYGNNGSTDCLISQSFDYDNYNYLYPNEYIVFPLSRIENSSNFNFYARLHYNNGYSDRFAVMISTSSNSNTADFTKIQEWTLNGEQNTWSKYTVNLNEYAGQTGYIAIRHYYNGNSTHNTLDIDDVILSNGNNSVKGDRHFNGYQVVLTDANNQVIYSGSTFNRYMQLPIENLIDGECYHFKVSDTYTSGTSEWIETDWVYQSCDHFTKVDQLNLEMDSESNTLSWEYPSLEGDVNVSTAFACKYSYNSWIRYNMDDPQTTTVLNENIQVYGGDYCGSDGYVHATSSSNNWYKIEPTTGEIVEQGSLGMYFYDCAWDYTTNTMFGIYDRYYLYLWDVEYNTTTYIGYMNQRMYVLACDLNGQLWGIDYYGNLYKIDKTTGGVTYIGNTGAYAYNSYQSGGFDHKTGKLYWAHGDGYLYEINTETCKLTFVASDLGRQTSWCIPYNGELSSPTNVLGAVVFRDDELIGLTYSNSFTDTLASGNHEYKVRVVYDGTKIEPKWNTYYTMSCPSIVGGEIYTVSATANPTAGGTIAGAGSYINGLYCTLNATVNEGYLFANWTENGEVLSNCPEYTFRVTDNRTLVGNFIENDQHWGVVDNPTYLDMSLIGVLQFNGVEQSADYLEVGAFCNGECRGSAMLSYNSQFHRSLLPMTIIGLNNDKITFKVYDHLRGEEIDLICLDELTFVMNQAVGSLISPYPINFGITQSTTVQNGWSWYSTYIEQEGINGLSMLEASLGEEGYMIKSQDDGFVINFDNVWTGSLNGINNEQMYMINTTAQATTNVTGNKVNVASHPITLYPGWTWMGNPYATSISLEDALVNLVPADGDILKTQQSFSTYLDDTGWVGSFNTLEPGLGLMYYSNDYSEKTLIYSENLNSKELKPNVTADNNHWKPNAFEYPFNMNMIAIAMLDDMEIMGDHYELATFVNDKCVGSSRLVYNEMLDRYIAFMTVFGEKSVDMHFKLYDMSTGTEYYSENDAISFEINSMIGSIAEPYIVHFNSLTAINPTYVSSFYIYPNPVSKGESFRIENYVDETELVTVEIIDALGVVMSVETVSKKPICITAPNTSGVYTIRIMVDGKVSYCRKLIVK